MKNKIEKNKPINIYFEKLMKPQNKTATRDKMSRVETII